MKRIHKKKSSKNFALLFLFFLIVGIIFVATQHKKGFVLGTFTSGVATNGTTTGSTPTYLHPTTPTPVSSGISGGSFQSSTTPIPTTTVQNTAMTTPTTTCTPRPACLDNNPPCRIAQSTNMCPSTKTPTATPTVNPDTIPVGNSIDENVENEPIPPDNFGDSYAVDAGSTGTNSDITNSLETSQGQNTSSNPLQMVVNTIKHFFSRNATSNNATQQDTTLQDNTNTQPTLSEAAPTNSHTPGQSQSLSSFILSPILSVNNTIAKSLSNFLSHTLSH